MLPDSEAPPAWGAASLAGLQPPSPTPAPEGKSAVPAAKKEPKEPKKVTAPRQPGVLAKQARCRQMRPVWGTVVGVLSVPTRHTAQ